MTLSPYDLMELDKLAAINADQGRHKASDAYHRHALGQRWHNSPAWIEGRTLYANAWMRHRAAYRAASAAAIGSGSKPSMQRDETLDDANPHPVSIRPHEAGPAHLCTESCGSRGAEWFCAMTQPRQEDRADDELRKQGFATFLPTVWERRTKNRKIVRVEVPMFDGYIFVRFDLRRDHWGAIVNTRGIRDPGLVGMRPGHPSPLPDELIAFVGQHATELNREFVARAKASLKGRSLRVTAGAWAGFVGECTMHRNDRVRVLLTLFGRATEVEMQASRVERVA